MQRLYVMFPDRAPGLGLLWMRLCTAAALCLSAGHTPWHMAAALAVSALITVGWLTPVSLLLAIGELLWVGPFSPLVLLPLGLLLLGPGAYSMDARAFGRKVVDLAGTPRHPKE